MRLNTQIRSLIIICMSVGLSPLLSESAEADPVLKYRYKSGQRLQYELKQTLTTKTEFSGQESGNAITQHLDLSTVVEKVLPDGSARVKKSIDRIRLKATQPGGRQELEYDSASQNEATGPFAMIVKSMSMLVGQEIEMTVSPLGESRDVVIPQSLIKRFSAPAAQMGGVNSSEGVTKMMSQGNVIFPEKTLSVGEKWKRELTTELPFGLMKSLVVFTYSGETKEGLHRIDAITTISIEPKENLPFQIKMTESQGRGVYMFDAKRGLILASGLKQVMNMEIQAAGQNTKQSVTTDISMRLVNAEAKVSLR